MAFTVLAVLLMMSWLTVTCRMKDCCFKTDWVELQLHLTWLCLCNDLTRVLSLSVLLVLQLWANIMVDALLASGHRWLTITTLIVFPTVFVQYPPPPCPFYPSFPAAFCPLNQSTVRFREEVNTLVLWLVPFLQRGLCNWKALGDYFKTLVGTDSHVCAMAGNGALSFC